jgi:4-hydroxy-tetrahydrodipicolinate synthase
MVRHALANDFTKATRLHRKLYPVFKAMFIEPNPVPVKAALARAGIIRSAEVRLPLTGISTENLQALTKVLAAFRR